MLSGTVYQLPKSIQVPPHKRERFFCIAWRELADTECDGQTGPTVQDRTDDISGAEQTGTYQLSNAT